MGIYDLYKEETYPALKTLFQQHMPRRIWFSARSDRWQPWGHLSHGTWQARQDLESRRRHECTMLRRMCSFLTYPMGRNSLLEIFWEWPTDSLGWKEPALRDPERAVWSRKKDWLACRVDGCRYGLREGRFYQKAVANQDHLPTVPQPLQDKGARAGACPCRRGALPSLLHRLGAITFFLFGTLACPLRPTTSRWRRMRMEMPRRPSRSHRQG